MSSAIELERVVFLENVDKPLTAKGGTPGLDKVFDADPKMGRNAYKLQLVGGFVRIQDQDSGQAEMVPVSFVRQMREMRPETAKRIADREAEKAKAKAAMPPQRASA